MFINISKNNFIFHMLKIKFKLILILLFVLTSSISNKVKSNLLSYSSEYEISLGDSSTLEFQVKLNSLHQDSYLLIGSM